MNKIIGFKISKNDIKNNIDIFNIGLSIKSIKIDKYNLFLWGIGDLDKCLINGAYTLSFPHTDSLKERNVIISIKNEEIIIENDWLGSIPVFYNSNTGDISTLFNEVIENKEISKEGINNFLEFGYSVFEQTPLEDVKFLRYLSKITVNKDEINIIKKDDILKKDLSLKKSENEIFNMIEEYINIDDKNNVDNYIIPTSGGFDSRILNICIKNKKKILAFTYGVSKKQCNSFEAVYAKKLCEILGIKWELIELNEFNKYIEEWYQIFGCSTHLHGMYQIEFYKKIFKKNKGVLVSGIVGDAFAGKVKVPNIDTINDLIYLGYTHGINCDLNMSKLISNNYNRERFFKEEKNKFNSMFNSIVIIRNKIILLSYLLTVPEYMGVPTISPFLNFDIVMSMLLLDEERRKNRIWQTEFFEYNDVNLEKMNLQKNNTNTLDLDNLKKYSFPKLNSNLLNEFIELSYINFINKNINYNKLNKLNNLVYDSLYIPKLGRILKKVGIVDKRIVAYNAFRTIYALQKTLES